MAHTVLIMDLSYALTPFLAWFIAGALKFIFNTIKLKKLSFEMIGYGGLPSNHSAIVSSMTSLIALKEGIAHPAFGVALTVSFIVMLDANSLRYQVGKQAASINKLTSTTLNFKPLRERMGHTLTEILAGIIVGILVSLTVNIYF